MIHLHESLAGKAYSLLTFSRYLARQMLASQTVVPRFIDEGVWDSLTSDLQWLLASASWLDSISSLVKSF